jgi:uncharacterized membrane protein YkoI
LSYLDTTATGYVVMKLLSRFILAALISFASIASFADESRSSNTRPKQASSSKSITLPEVPASNSAAARAIAPPSLSQADAANIVRNKTGGQVMAVQPRVVNGRTHYAVKVLSEGRMRTIHVDGDSGNTR